MLWFGVWKKCSSTEHGRQAYTRFQLNFSTVSGTLNRTASSHWSAEHQKNSDEQIKKWKGVAFTQAHVH